MEESTSMPLAGEKPGASFVEETEFRVKVRAEIKAKYEAEFKELSERLKAENSTALDAAIKQIREEMTPPKETDIQKLLDQEYLTFAVKIPCPYLDGTTGTRLRLFTLVELPQSVERKILRQLKQKLIPITQELSALTVNLLSGDASEKIKALMESVEPVMDAMICVTTIILNPYGKEPGIDEDWVQENVSIDRILRIISAQMQCNRVRDFFSLVAQASRRLV